MSDMNEPREVVGRKQYRCAGCQAPIPRGEKHWHYTGRWQGDWQNWRMHRECWQAHCANVNSGWSDGTIYECDPPVRIQAMSEGSTK